VNAVGLAVLLSIVMLAAPARPVGSGRPGARAIVPPIAPLGFVVKWIDILPDADPYRTMSYRSTDPRHRQVSPDGRSLLITRVASCGLPAPCSFLWLERSGYSPVLIHRQASWVSWNRTGTGFAFVGRRDAERAYPRSIYVYTLDPLRALRRIDVDPNDYVWSPLGGTLAIVGRAGPGAIPERPQPVEIFLAPAHGNTLKLIDRVPPRRDPRQRSAWWTPDVPGLSWSPDGRFLVYSVVQSAAGESETFAADLFVATAEGSGRQQLTQTPRIVETWPRWVTVDQIVTLRTHMRVAGMLPRRVLALEAERWEGGVLNLAVPR
jgi:WD40 repeat protein